MAVLLQLIIIIVHLLQTLKDEDTKKDYDYMLDHPGICS